MPSGHIAAAVLLVAAAGCLAEEPPPDIDRLHIRVVWVNGYRDVEVSVPEIPCTGTKDGFLGEEGVECESAPWTLTVDGAVFETTPVKCTAAHEGLFGPVDEYCTGGRAYAALPDVASEDVEILASTGAKHTRRVLSGVRRTYAWTEETPFQGSSHPGLVRVEEGLELGTGPFSVSLMRPDGAPARGSARRPSADVGELELSLDFGNHINGVYSARVQAYVRQDAVTIAVPIEGTLTVAE